MSGQEKATYEGNLQKLGYADFAKPSTISVSEEFDAKAKVVDILIIIIKDGKSGKDDEQVITYTDIVGTMMNSVTDIINIISYVLIAFVAISLIVSSTAIGDYTYHHVLERKKEIGILRAMEHPKEMFHRCLMPRHLSLVSVQGLWNRTDASDSCSCKHGDPYTDHK